MWAIHHTSPSEQDVTIDRINALELVHYYEVISFCNCEKMIFIFE